MVKHRLFRATLRALIAARAPRHRPRVCYQPIAEVMERRALQSGLTAGAAIIETVRPSVAAHIIAVLPSAVVHVNTHASHDDLPSAAPVGTTVTSGASVGTTNDAGADDAGSQPPSNNVDDSTGEGGVVNQDPSGS